MELERNLEKFSFFKTDKKPGKHNFILAAIAALLIGPSVFMFGVHVADEVYKELSTKPQNVFISHFDSKQVKDFSVKALSEMMTLDKNYSHQAIDAMDNYMTGGGSQSYAEILDKQYRQKIELFKISDSRQTINVDRYSVVNLVSSNRGNIYRVKYQEKLLNNKVETVTDKMACLHLIEKNQQLKIANIAVADFEQGCSLSLE